MCLASWEKLRWEKVEVLLGAVSGDLVCLLFFFFLLGILFGFLAPLICLCLISCLKDVLALLKSEKMCNVQAYR